MSSASSRIACGTSRRCITTRISATTAVAARRQQVQILIARWRQATSWFSPELLRIPIATIRDWMAASAELAVYRFAIEDLFRQQAHVLDAVGEQLMSLSGRLVFNTRRRLFRAVDGGCAVPDHHALDR